MFVQNHDVIEISPKILLPFANYFIRPFFRSTILAIPRLVPQIDLNVSPRTTMRLFHVLIQFSKPVPLRPLNPLTSNIYLLYPNQACRLRCRLENKGIVVLLWQDKYHIPESLPDFSSI